MICVQVKGQASGMLQQQQRFALRSLTEKETNKMWQPTMPPDPPDTPCTDPEINAKCLLLDIEIWRNGTANVNMKVGSWFIARRTTENDWGVVYWRAVPGVAGDIAEFKTPAEALKVYIDGNDKYCFS